MVGFTTDMPNLDEYDYRRLPNAAAFSRPSDSRPEMLKKQYLGSFFKVWEKHAGSLSFDAWDDSPKRALFENLKKALYLLSRSLPMDRLANLLLPYVSVFNNGQIQIEWHEKGYDLEVRFADSGNSMSIEPVKGECRDIESDQIADFIPDLKDALEEMVSC